MASRPPAPWWAYVDQNTSLDTLRRYEDEDDRDTTQEEPDE